MCESISLLCISSFFFAGVKRMFAKNIKAKLFSPRDMSRFMNFSHKDTFS